MRDRYRDPDASREADITATPTVDYSKKYWVQLAVGMGIFLGTIDGSIVNVALPTLVETFDTSFAAVQWVALGYLLVMATLVLGVGRLGDMVGKKPIYAAGFAVFTFGSVLCGVAPGVGWLIGFRLLQGVGAAMIFALGFAIITEAFPPTERGRALGVNGAIVSLGIVTGPILGGLLIESLSWRWIFLVNLPVGIVGTLTALRFVPDVPPPGGQRFDFPGAATFLAGLLTLLLGLTLGQDLGFTHPTILSLLLAAAVALVVFIRVERRVEQPMLDLTLFSNRLFTTNLVTGWITFVGVGGVLVLLPFYLESVLGYGPRRVGFLLAALPLALGVIAPISGALSDRHGARIVTVVGLAIQTAAYALLVRLGTGTGAWEFALLTVPVGVGIGVFQSPNNSAVMGSVPPQRLGVTSGMLTITRITGQIAGISVLGTLWAARAIAGSGGIEAAQAPPAAQAAALRETAAVVALLTAIGLWLAWRGLVAERRAADADAPPV